MVSRPARRSLLLVDDYEDAREMYAECFAAAGYDVATAADGEEAVEKAMASTFDAVILDLALPGMDGIQVIAALRKNAATERLPILVLSASAGPQMRREAMEAGADLYLYKPCLPDELEAAVRRFLEQDRQREDLVSKTVIDGVAGLRSLVGKTLGQSAWREMTYDAIRKFADATGDHQWIHVDRERIARESPFKKPIAHGYFTVSLIAGLFFDLVEIRNFGMVINYGLNKVRFPAPLKEGQRYRLDVKLGDLKEVSGAQEALLNAAVEIEGEGKPACVAEVVFRFYSR